MADNNKQNETEQPFVNPIDSDTITDSPHNLPYAHHRGSVEIKPVDRGRIKGTALEAMYDQTDRQLNQIREQIELLARQAQAITDRVHVSEKIYQAKMNFKPLINHIYHLYEKADGSHVLSLVAPEEWGSSCPYQFEATVRLLADHTWEIV